MGRLGIHIARNNVGLHFVALHARARRGMGDWIQHPEQFAGLIAVAERRKGNDRPRGSMGVLAAIFTDAGHITLNVAWVMLACCQKAV